MIGGVIFSVLSSLAMNVGNLIEKRAVDSLPRLSGRPIAQLFRILLTSRLWMVGFGVCLLGLGFQVVAFALAPIAVVQSIFNAGIVVLVVGSRLHLREHLHRREVVGLIIVIMSVIAVGATVRAEGNVATAVSGIAIALVSVPTVGVVAGVLVLVKTGGKAKAFLFGIGAGLLYGLAGLATKGASIDVAVYGVLGSVSHILSSGYPYMFVVVSLLALVLYQNGIQRARIAVVGAMSDVVASTYVVVVGSVVFGGAVPHDGTWATLRFLGFAGVVAGSTIVALGGRNGGSGSFVGAGAGDLASASAGRNVRRRPAHAAPRRSIAKLGGRSR